MMQRKPEAMPLIRVLRGARVDPPPIWLMRQAGRYLPEYQKARAAAGSFLNLCYTPKLAAEVTVQPIRRYRLDAAIVFADILVVPHAMGQDVRFEVGHGPVLAPVRDAAGLARLDAPGAVDRLAPVCETLGRVAADLPPEVALIGFAGAPWTVATYMVEGAGSRDYAHAKGWAFRDPDGFAALIDLVTETTVAYLIRQIDAGADAVQVFDTWAGALARPELERWCFAPTRRIVDAVRGARPRTPIIGFPKGVGANLVDYVDATGVDAVGLDTAAPLQWAARELQPRCAVQGNLDPALLRVGGPAMAARARETVAALGGGPHVFNLGHGVIKETPPEHVAALVEAVREGARS